MNREIFIVQDATNFGERHACRVDDCIAGLARLTGTQYKGGRASDGVLMEDMPLVYSDFERQKKWRKPKEKSTYPNNVKINFRKKFVISLTRVRTH